MRFYYSHKVRAFYSTLSGLFNLISLELKYFNSDSLKHIREYFRWMRKVLLKMDRFTKGFWQDGKFDG